MPGYATKMLRNRNCLTPNGELSVEKKIMKHLLIALVVFLFSAGLPLICQAEKAAVKEKAPKAKATGVKAKVEKATLTLGAR